MTIAIDDDHDPDAVRCGIAAGPSPGLELPPSLRRAWNCRRALAGHGIAAATTLKETGA